MKKANFYYRDESAPTPNKPNHIGTCAIIRNANTILLEYRTDSDFWALIGGGLEIDESAEDGMLREISEETGLEISKSDLKFFNLYSDPSRIIEYPDGNIIRSISVAYTVDLKTEHRLICSRESRELKYFSLDELSNIEIVATHRHIIDDYLEILET